MEAVLIRKTIIVRDDWGKVLGKAIAAAESRVASYKKLTAEAYKSGNQELVPVFKKIKQEEEKHLKSLRWEKTCWNHGCWEWYFMNPEGGKIQ